MTAVEPQPPPPPTPPGATTVGAGIAPPPPPAVPGRAALTITAWNAVSRVTGFARVLAVAAALGTTFLGNTYQSSNLVSNLLFEVLAAGLLSAPLVPAFVALIDDGDAAGADRLAGGLLGLALVALGAIVVVLAIAGHQVMAVLTSGAPPAVRHQEQALGAFFLWFFLPQVLLYAIGAVASALLHAERRFSAVAGAPVANNLVVTATMVAYLVVQGTARQGLEVPLGPRLLLAAGTTAGVVAMTAIPLVALRRRGHRLRLRLRLDDPRLRAVARIGAWGGVLLAASEVLVGLTLVLANGVEGGVVAYQTAFTFFLLPFALVAHPIFTSLYPGMAAAAHAGRWTVYGDDLARGLGRTTLLVAPAAALLAALAGPALRLVRLGALDRAGADLVARVLAAYAVGLVGYAAFQLLARAATATGDARLPAMVGLGVAAFGAVLMVGAVAVVGRDDRVPALGLAHGVAMTGGALVLHRLLVGRLHLRVSVGATVGRALAAAAAAGGAAWAATHVVVGAGRPAALVQLVLGGTGGVAAAVAVLAVLREPELRTLVGRR